MNLTIHSGKQNLDLVRLLCETAGASAGPNYSIEWKQKPHTLIWQLLEGHLSAPSADYLIATDGQGRPICGAGYYDHPDFRLGNAEVTMVMVRMWTHPEYRMRFLGTPLLRIAAERSTKQVCMVSFNQHNKALHTSLTVKRSGLPWPPEWRGFVSVGQLELNYVKQWCAAAPTHSILT